MPPRPMLPGQSAASVPGIGNDASLSLLVCKCPSSLPSGHYLSVHFARMTHTCTAVYTGHNRTLTILLINPHLLQCRRCQVHFEHTNSCTRKRVPFRSNGRSTVPTQARSQSVSGLELNPTYPSLRSHARS